MANFEAAFDRLSGRVAEIQRALRDFSASAQLLSSDQPRLIDDYEHKWVGVYKGQIAVVADTLDELNEQIARKHLPAGETLVRYIDREEKTLIL